MRNALLRGVGLILLLAPSPAIPNPGISVRSQTLCFQGQALANRLHFVNPSHRWPRDLLAIPMLGDEIEFDADTVFSDTDAGLSAGRLVTDMLEHDNAYARLTLADTLRFADAYLLYAYYHAGGYEAMDIYDPSLHKSQPYEQNILRRKYDVDQRFRLRRSLQTPTRIEIIPEPEHAVIPWTYQRSEGGWLQVEGASQPGWSYLIEKALQAFGGHSWQELNIALDRIHITRLEMFNHPRLNVPEETRFDRKSGTACIPIKSRLAEVGFEEARLGAILKGLINVFDGGEPGLRKDLRTYAWLWAFWVFDRGADVVDRALVRMMPDKNLLAATFRLLESNYVSHGKDHGLSRTEFIDSHPDLVETPLRKMFEWIDKLHPTLRYSQGRPRDLFAVPLGQAA